MRIALAAAGAFGVKHLEGLARIDGVEVVSLAGRELDETRAVAAKFAIPHVTTDLAESLALRVRPSPGGAPRATLTCPEH